MDDDEGLSDEDADEEQARMCANLAFHRSSVHKTIMGYELRLCNPARRLHVP
eukprot:COSAG02_NODE_36131_length_458_cov_1.275766_2_plen_51_part_01